ncbi:unnamed protein product, partial [Rotaria sordida]
AIHVQNKCSTLNEVNGIALNTLNEVHEQDEFPNEIEASSDDIEV